jgi:hypothetical protein
MEGEKMESHQKGFFLKLKCCSPLRILTSPLFEETLGAFLFLPLFSLFFSMLRLLRTWGVLMILEEKNHFFKNFFFQMEWHGHDCGYTGGGHIFQNGVMHANIAKP